MPTVVCNRFFPDSISAEAACDRIETELAALKLPKSRRAQVWQRVVRGAAAGYVAEARGTSSQAKKWRSIAEAMFWWSAAFSLSSDVPFCQQSGAAAQRPGFEKRAAEAWRVFRTGDPKTGKPFKSKEACKLHLAATNGWSRSSCNEYLKDENEV